MKIFDYILKLFFLIPFIRKKIFFQQLIRFTIVGGIATVIDFAIYIFLTRGFSFWQENYFWANLIALFIGATLNFNWNRQWTFFYQRENIWGPYFKFWLVVVVTIILYQFFFYLLVNFLFFFDLLAKIIVAILIMLIRFAIQKYWVFK